ncbi:hypothetical protein D3C75_648810 [compost metagenome]|nr:hypothetical protein R70331_07225 [Paenibacillus sp. FSL R7-0331]
MGVTPEDGPNAPETKDLVNEIRDLSGSGNMELLVIGAIADVFGFPGSSAILFLLPVLCIGILFGLSMD